MFDNAIRVSRLLKKNFCFSAVACLVVTPNKVKPASEQEKFAAINLCLHPTIGDPVGQDSHWKTSFRIMLLVLGFAVPLRGDLTGASFSRLCWGADWNSSISQLKWTTTTTVGFSLLDSYSLMKLNECKLHTHIKDYIFVI